VIVKKNVLPWSGTHQGTWRNPDDRWASPFRDSVASAGSRMDEIITPEEYFREHAARLRAYARYTRPEASNRLIESAQFLEARADAIRDQNIAKSKVGAARAAVRKSLRCLNFGASDKSNPVVCRGASPSPSLDCVRP